MERVDVETEIVRVGVERMRLVVVVGVEKERLMWPNSWPAVRGMEGLGSGARLGGGGTGREFWDLGTTLDVEG